MTTLSDARFEALRTQGFIGSTSDMLLQWLHANGATSGHISDAWLEMLTAQGITARHTNDAWFEYLGSLGLTGTVNDRELAFWLGGGTFTQLVFNGTDQYATHAPWTPLGDPFHYLYTLTYTTDTQDGLVLDPTPPISEFARTDPVLTFDGATYIAIPPWNPTTRAFEVRIDVEPFVMGNTSQPVIGNANGDWPNNPYRTKLRAGQANGNWQFQYMSAADQMRSIIPGVYVDNQRVGLRLISGENGITGVASGTGNNVACDLSLYILDAIGQDEYTEFFRGIIYDVKLIDYASPANSRHYPMNDGGTTIVDVLNGQNGTLVGNANWSGGGYHAGSLLNVRYTDRSPLHNADYATAFTIPNLDIINGAVEFDFICKSLDDGPICDLLTLTSAALVPTVGVNEIWIDSTFYQGQPLNLDQHYTIRLGVTSGALSQFFAPHGYGRLSATSQGG